MYQLHTTSNQWNLVINYELICLQIKRKMKKKKEKKQKMQLIYNIELSNVVRGRWKVYFLILLKSPIGAILRSEK